MAISDQWQYAEASWCRQRRGHSGVPPHHEGEIQTLSHCRNLSMSGDAGPKIGHEACEALLTAEGIQRLLVDPQ